MWSRVRQRLNAEGVGSDQEVKRAITNRIKLVPEI